jgi:hypothetical protein
MVVKGSLFVEPLNKRSGIAVKAPALISRTVKLQL